MKPFDDPRQPGPAPPTHPQPLDLLAQLLLSLSYGDMLSLAADLHSDIETHTPKPIDIADQLWRWAKLTAGHTAWGESREQIID